MTIKASHDLPDLTTRGGKPVAVRIPNSVVKETNMQLPSKCHTFHILDLQGWGNLYKDF